jgi:WhiB family redox-sensing transcriptional regulator
MTDGRLQSLQRPSILAKEASVPLLDARELVEQLDWQEDGLCRQYNVEIFFGPDQPETEIEKDAREEHAKAICRHCPVITPCLEFAMDTNQKYGIWGGLTDRERASLKRRRARSHRAS